MKEPSTSYEVQAALDWLLQELETTDYGEVGFTLSVHAGEVKKVARHVTTNIASNQRGKRRG